MKMNARTCTWEEITPCNSTDWGLTEEVWQKKTWGLGGQQVEHESAACPWGNEGYLHTGLYETEHNQQDDGNDYSLLIGMSETISGAVQFWGPHCKKHINKLEQVQSRVADLLTQLEHITCGQRLRGVCVLSLEERRLRRHSAAVFNNITGGYVEDRIRLFSEMQK